MFSYDPSKVSMFYSSREDCQLLSAFMASAAKAEAGSQAQYDHLDEAFRYAAKKFYGGDAQALQRLAQDRDELIAERVGEAPDPKSDAFHLNAQIQLAQKNLSGESEYPPSLLTVCAVAVLAQSYNKRLAAVQQRPS